MSQYMYGGDAQTVTFAPLDASAVLSAHVAALQAQPIAFYNAPAGGSKYTLTLSDGTTTADHITTDGNGIWPRFYGPDGVTQMWADAGGSTRLLVSTTDLPALAAAAASAASAAQTTANTALAAANAGAGVAKFSVQGNASGPLSVGPVFNGGVRVDYGTVLSGMVISVDQEPQGADLIAQLIVRSAAFGTDTVAGSATIAHDVSRRGTLTGLSVTVNPGDRLFVRITQVGTTNPGSDLDVSILGPNATVAAAQTAPPAVTGLTAVQSTTDVALAWTNPTSGVWSGVDIYADGVFLDRVPRGTATYLNADAADQAHTYTVEAWNSDAVSADASVAFTPGTSTGGITDLGIIGQGTATTGKTAALPVSKAVAAGTVVLVAVAASGTAGGNSDTWSATDSKGNTYQVDAYGYSAGATDQTVILSAALGTALTTSDSITVTCTTGMTTPRIAATARAVSGLKTTGRTDQTAGNASATNSKNLTTAGSGTLSQPVEYAYVAFAHLPATATAGSGWNLGNTVPSSAGSNDRQVSTEWQIVNATTTLTGTMTITVSSAYTGAVATYKGA